MGNVGYAAGRYINSAAQYNSLGLVSRATGFRCTSATRDDLSSFIAYISRQQFYWTTNRIWSSKDITWLGGGRG
jgi:hypothetical protein